MPAPKITPKEARHGLMGYCTVTCWWKLVGTETIRAHSVSLSLRKRKMKGGETKPLTTCASDNSIIHHQCWACSEDHGGLHRGSVSAKTDVPSAWRILGGHFHGVEKDNLNLPVLAKITMCRSLFCKPLEHTDRFPSSGSLLSNSVFGPTLVLSISAQFPETLAGRLPWLEPVRASFVRRVFHGQSHQSSRKGHWPQVNDSSGRYCLGFPGFPPPLQFCLPHLAPFQGAWQQCHCPCVTTGTARLREDGKGPSCD